jgi:hypothetical protein
VPFKPTPPVEITDQRDLHRRAEPDHEPFEVHELEPPENLVRMDRFKSQRDNDGGGPDAA